MDEEAELKTEPHTSENNEYTEGLNINTEIYKKDTDINSSLESILGYISEWPLIFQWVDQNP